MRGFRRGTGGRGVTSLLAGTPSALRHGAKRLELSAAVSARRVRPAASIALERLPLAHERSRPHETIDLRLDAHVPGMRVRLRASLDGRFLS